MSKQYNYFTYYSSFTDTRESNKFSHISRKCFITFLSLSSTIEQ